MDWINLRGKAAEAFGKYKYVLLILAVGIFLMILPARSDALDAPVVQETVPVESGTTQALEEILSQIEGVGKVQVLLTESAGSQTIYQTDEDSTGSSDSHSIRIETVIVSDDSRAEFGLIRQVNPPVYRGAVVVCQGGDSPAVQLAVVSAVSNATGLSADRIAVLKMK